MIRHASLVAAAVCVLGAPAVAQQLYRYHDENGTPVYADRPPAAPGASYETERLGRHAAPAAVSLHQRVGEDQSVVLVARNDYYAPVELLFELVAMENLDASAPASGLRVVPARSELKLLTLRRADASREMRLEYGFRYLPGDPTATHAPDAPYRLPYAAARGFEVSQAWPDALTHTDAGSRHAVDFVMPVGTGVYAARGGIVIDVAADFFESGTGPGDRARANVVRILHNDGTMALYAHLNWNSIRVTHGQRVSRGEYLADSGNTGFSTGPHLHFVVQRNAGAALESVPVEFAGVRGRGVSLKTGDRPVAY